MPTAEPIPSQAQHKGPRAPPGAALEQRQESPQHCWMCYAAAPPPPKVSGKQEEGIWEDLRFGVRESGRMRQDSSSSHEKGRGFPRKRRTCWACWEEPCPGSTHKVAAHFGHRLLLAVPGLPAIRASGELPGHEAGAAEEGLHALLETTGKNRPGLWDSGTVSWEGIPCPKKRTSAQMGRGPSGAKHRRLCRGGFRQEWGLWKYATPLSHCPEIAV